MGIVTYRGVQYAGTHEPLISRDTFQAVQAVLEAHGLSGEKQRTHQHYLKGTVFCGQCGSRLSIMKTKNRHGTMYPYFFCLGRQEKRTHCRQQAVLIELVEHKVLEYYATVALTVEQRQAVQTYILEQLQQNRAEMEADRDRARRGTIELVNEREKLLQAHYADAIPLELLKREQERIGRELAQAQRLIEASEVEFSVVEARLEGALGLIQN